MHQESDLVASISNRFLELLSADPGISDETATSIKDLVEQDLVERSRILESVRKGIEEHDNPT